MRHASANPSTTQVNAALAEAKAGRYLILRGVYISSDTQMMVSLVNSVTHDLVWRQYIGALGGQGFGGSPENDLAHSTLSEGLDLSTSTNGNVFVSIAFSYNGD